MNDMSKNTVPAETARVVFKAKSVFAPISFGELIDRITILEIKSERIQDEGKLRNIRIELNKLRALLCALEFDPGVIRELKNELRSVNEKLWNIEDWIRELERRKEFGPDFVELARSVYITNDRRAYLKRYINEIAHSEIIDEKSYQDYSSH